VSGAHAGDGARVGVVVMAHGTPERIEDVESFYTEIRRGRPPSPDQLAELEGRYRAIGGTSPLNATTRAQAEGITAALERKRPGRYVVRHGARFAAPRIEQAVEELADAGVHRLIGIVLAPHSSYASVKEYERRLDDAAATARTRRHRSLPLTMVDHWYDTPGFTELVAKRVRAALDALPPKDEHTALVVFTAHSVPARLISAGDTYAEQLAESARAVADASGLTHWTVAWQSAGRTDEEWLGPDIREVIVEQASAGTTAVVVCPVGFVADHLEILYDLDVEACAVADKAGLSFVRTASFNDDAAFCEVVAEAVLAADTQ